MALYFVEKAWPRSAPADTKTWRPFEVPDEAIGCGFHEAVRGVLSHHLVIRDGKIANYHPYPPTPWNASPRDIYGTPGPTRTPCRTRRSSRRTAADNFKGIDIMRTVRSFDPCLPCGVHMYLWTRLRERNTVLHTLEPDVEALLVDRTNGGQRYWLVPIDVCYELVAVIRENWKGLAGGHEVWERLALFFDDLAQRARVVTTRERHSGRDASAERGVI
jgi:hypothetical protein